MKNERDTLSVEDKIDKVSVQVGYLLRTISTGLNTEPVMILDNEGYAQFLPRNQNDTFHTDDTWKALGLLHWGTDKYPAMSGRELYHDQSVIGIIV